MRRGDRDLGTGEPRGRRARCRREGVALVEFALCSVLFFLVTFGIMDFGRAIWEYNLVSSAAREGVRHAVVCGSASRCGGGHGESLEEVQAYVKSRMVGVPVIELNVKTIGPDGKKDWPEGNQPGNIVEVQVQHTFTPVLPFIPRSALTLQSRSRMIISR